MNLSMGNKCSTASLVLSQKCNKHGKLFTEIVVETIVIWATFISSYSYVNILFNFTSSSGHDHIIISGSFSTTSRFLFTHMPLYI